MKQKQPLTPILPPVVYHGKRRWKKRSLPAYFDEVPQPMIAFLPTFDYVLVDLSAISQRRPEFSTDYARVTGLLLQHSRRQRQFLNVLENLSDVLRRMANDAMEEHFMETAFLYACWTTDLTKVEVIAIFRKISNQTAEIALSTAERLTNKGVERGMEKGTCLVTAGYEHRCNCSSPRRPPDSG